MGRQVRPIRVAGDVAYIPLTKGYEAVIDAFDVPLVCGHNWFAAISGDVVYARRSGWKDGKPLTVRLHRALLGDPPDVLVDHRDGDGLNNRRSNLRTATRAQNGQNVKPRKTNSSGFKGVTWHKENRRWCAQIKAQGVKKHIGYFATAEEAASAYADASNRLHGEFGRTA